MFEGIRTWHRRRWQQATKAERVELYSVVSWRVMAWLFTITWLVTPVVGGLHQESVPRVVGWLLVAVGVAQCVTTHRLVQPVLDHYLGRDRLPPGTLRTPAAQLVAALALALTLSAVDGADPAVPQLACGGALIPFALLYGFVVPPRVFVWRLAAGVAVLTGLAGLLEKSVSWAVTTGVAAGLSALLALLASRCGAWTLAVLWEAEHARAVEARLAVAEERLRFGRDLHDVLGRNLAVIALKSELAVRLAHKGRPEAVEQMEEVQRIAQESQRDVRAVVRGYRETDLEGELAGARGVLQAAGITCEVAGDAARASGLPAEVRSALGWVVREAATNVLRHGNATRCSVSIGVTDDRLLLTVVNDGVGGVSGSGTGSGSGSGSGIAGLRERLAAVGGTLEAGAHGDVFRLVAEVPPGGTAMRQAVAERTTVTEGVTVAEGTAGAEGTRTAEGADLSAGTAAPKGAS